ncbi:MAG TPA: nuclear transport factor 2 family protein [Verrucomicrobiae bacterium]|nr:nuclear transport factor 2 family protein [Verrucomicrobiae bacterium]
MNDTTNFSSAVQDMYAAFGRGDVPAILKHLHHDVEWAVNVDYKQPAARKVPCYEPGRGHAFVGRFFGLFAQGYEVSDFRLLSVMEGENEVAARVKFDLTVRGSGKRVAGEALHHFTFDPEGRVIRFLDFEDTLGFANAWN